MVPLLLNIFKGEGHILLVPSIRHIDGCSVDSDGFINIEN